MNNIRTLDDVKRELKQDIYAYEARIEAWENVTFNAKKDGTPFKNLSKNFNGAEIGDYHPVERSYLPYLTVYGHEKRLDGGTRYFSDHVSIVWGGNHYNGFPEHNKDREVRYSPYSTNYEVLTIDEIKKEIQCLIKKYKKNAMRCRLALENDAIFDEVEKKINTLCAIFNMIDCTELKFALREYAKYNI